MNPKRLAKMGFPQGVCLGAAIEASRILAEQGLEKAQIKADMESLAENPAAYVDHAVMGQTAVLLLAERGNEAAFRPRGAPAPYRIWGNDIEDGALTQMAHAAALPVSARGALMPDAHQGYGLPIGGVLAVRGAVIPFAVGMDIACRMKLTVLDLPTDYLDRKEDALIDALETETRFGVGAKFKNKRRHAVLDEDWSVSPVTDRLKDKAWGQLGTSGSGNHFVEFGVLTLDHADLGLEAGEYLALMSHSGSRGTGGQLATHYSKLAKRLHPELPRELSALAWLDLDCEAGREYWAAMTLMGKYAAANHELIHRHIAEHLGAEVKADIENHHNFAWLETHDGEELVVHRKGATPAGKGVLGVIPGSMGTAAYVARGLGNGESLNSASHGAGRRMSRTQAKARYTWKDAAEMLRERRIKVLSAGLDEVPMSYKDIEEVMQAQSDLVEKVARFMPRLVKMAPSGEPPED